ncbi:hypothetical protein BA895_07780 [Humibacillus sp. DSM 29435]|uniref:hypothetical protein n=1 Tax=Humibacillus sp. DSM 29435 TaxID=1869167 RepID=UPI0008720A8C|nr:hypothetical protein [Humibacillus sp. DSM 29435]OFE15025.1 hypothetical protein BA895_07780 [Humibacillus sp. DSM 29435]
MPEVASIIESVARVLSLAAVPVLAVAVVVSFVRPGRATLRSWRPVVVAISSCVFVVAVAVVGVVAGQRAGIPWTAPWTGVAALVLVGLLLRRDERFWAGLSVLVLAYGLVGWVSVLGLSHSYATETGGWRGVRLLVAWAGPQANPQAPDFTLAVAYLSIVQYGIPLAVTVAVAWVLATRSRMSRLERVALLLVGGMLLAEVIVGATLSTITLAVGVVAGLPLLLGVAALLGSLLMLVTVGPGAATGIVVGVHGVVTAREGASASGLVTMLRDRGSAGGSDRDRPTASAGPVSSALPRFLRGDVAFVQRLNIVIVVLSFVVVGGLTFTYRVFLGDPNRVEVAYQYVVSERPIDGRVLRALDGAAQTMWLVTRDHHLMHFDPATQQTRVVDLAVSDARQLGDRVVALTDEPTPRVVLVGGSAKGAPVRVTPVLVLARGSAPTLAVVGNTAFVAERGGRLVAVSTKGVVVRQKKFGPLTAVLAEAAQGKVPGVLWTLQPATPDDASEGATYTAVQRNPATLAVVSQQAVTGTEVLRWASGLTYDTGSAAFSPRPEDTAARWTAGPQGRLDLFDAGRRVRYDFHYDAVIGVRETSLGTWLVVDDHTGLALTPRAEPTSYLVRWPGAPKPAKAG